MQKSTEQIKTGSTYREKFSYTQENVDDFAKISGDKNPLHIDEEYASKSISVSYTHLTLPTNREV